jgi:hypothetical protein
MLRSNGISVPDYRVGIQNREKEVKALRPVLIISFLKKKGGAYGKDIGKGQQRIIKSVGGIQEAWGI